jgi:allantoinase
MSDAPFDLVVRSRRVVTPDGVRDAVIAVRHGRIEFVGAIDEIMEDLRAFPETLVDFSDRVVLPGAVDVHVHVNEPGRTEWEGFATATAAAAAGGVTTIVDMPLNSSPVTTSVAALIEKQESARHQCRVDVGFHGGLVPESVERMAELAASGVLGVKTFLCDSGLDEFPATGRHDLRTAMASLAAEGLPLLAHAELDEHVGTVHQPSDYASYLASRPRKCEHAAIRLLIETSRETGCRVHIVHLSSADALDALADARQEGVPISVETCPHYLFFDSTRIDDGNTRLKCAPPIRESENRERLWQGLLSGQIDLVASDHSPCLPAMKHLDSGDFARAWGGIASLGLGLAALWTEGRERGVTLPQLAEWTSAAPAALVGISDRKGAIAPGRDADLVIWDPDAEFAVTEETLCFRHPLSPYVGATLAGVVEKTYLRGHVVFDSGEFTGEPRGELLSRSR